MGIESKEIAKRVYCHNGARHGPLLRHGFLEEFFQGFPAATAEIGEQLSVIEEIPTEDFGDTEDEMSVRNGLEHFFAEPLAKFHNPLLVARGTEMAAFA